MSTEQLDRLGREAMQRIVYHINRSAAQQMRRWKEKWSIA